MTVATLAATMKCKGDCNGGEERTAIKKKKKDLEGLKLNQHV
jgi:hypothetical protein